MNEERFELDGAGIFDNKTNRFFYKTFDNEEVVNLLNEQQEEIRKLNENMKIANDKKKELKMKNFALKRLCEEYIIKIERLENM